MDSQRAELENLTILVRPKRRGGGSAETELGSDEQQGIVEEDAPDNEVLEVWTLSWTPSTILCWFRPPTYRAGSVCHAPSLEATFQQLRASGYRQPSV